MHSFFIHIPPWFQKLFPRLTWSVATEKNEMYLTFDDGPTPEVTEWVLETLAKFNAKATFFCIGKNMRAHPEITAKIIAGGHRIGNHSYNHLNGWKTNSEKYLADIAKTQQVLDRYKPPHNSRLFRPPYGRISPLQAKKIRKQNYQIVLWNVLSADFDPKTSPLRCAENVLKHSSKGAVIVFHDSKKAATNLRFALPKVLEYFTEKGVDFKALP